MRNWLKQSFFRTYSPVLLQRIMIGVWAVLLVAVLFCEWRYRQPENKIPQIRSFQRELIRQIAELDSATYQVARQLTPSVDEMWVLMSSLSQSPYQFVVFHDTVPLVWNAPQLNVSGKCIYDFDVSPVRLANGWYLSSVVRRGNVGVVGLMLLKSEYSYQNQYLTNRFNSCFGIDDGFELTFGKGRGGSDLYDGRGHYLFSLVYPYGLGPSTEYSWWGFVCLIIWLFLSGILFAQWIAHVRWRAWLWGIGAMGGYVLFHAIFVARHISFFDAIEVFSPVWFAYNSYLSSLGNLLAAIVYVTYFIWLFVAYYPKPLRLLKKTVIIRIAAWGMLVVGLWLINWVVYIMVEHSPDVQMFMHISDYNGLSFIKIGVIFLMMFSYGMLTHRLIPIIWIRRRLSLSIFSLLSASIILWGMVFIIPSLSGWGAFLFFIGWILLNAWLYRKPWGVLSFRYIIWFLLLADVYSVGRVYRYNTDKEHSNRNFLIEMLAGNMTGAHDPVAEMYLSDKEGLIERDANIRSMISAGDVFDEELKQYLTKNYFFGYLGRYDIQVIPCWPGVQLYVDGSNVTQDCYRYFNDMLLQYGEQVSGCRHFFLLKKDNGQVNYFGVFRYFAGIPGLELTLFVELTSKPYFEGPGYPELLLSDKDRAQFQLMEGYSYAGYVGGKLVKRGGNYLYDVRMDVSSLPVGSKLWKQGGNNSHLIYAYRPGAMVVMSYPLIRLSNFLIAFTFFFVGFLLLVTVLITGFKLFRKHPVIPYSIRQRIQISMISFMVFLLLVVGVSTVVYTSWQFKRKNEQMLSQRLKSVMLEMEQRIGSEAKLTPAMADYLSYLLQNFSNVFYSDINLYGLDGQMLASSRPELTRRGVIGNLMDPEAFRALRFSRQREYIHRESIGDLEFTSAYVPLLNQQNDVLAYVNIPYFVGSNELREEISSILVAIINAYLIFVLVAIGMALIASRQITRPLQLIRQRLSQTRLGLKNEKIVYSGTDEIGHLVETYNRMVDELAQSAEMLARSERELAWREMAKQVAHEIKNPLTPMKLSVQYLQKAWKDQVPNFDTYIQRVTQTLIDQIQQLSVIATEFSHFAKMPVARREPITVVDKLRNTVSLYEQSSEVEFELDIQCDPELKVVMDGEQLLSVFNNLIKNGVQAIHEERKGKVFISVSEKSGFMNLSFQDNGKGIPAEVQEKMFVPNFTTKTSGMGLGLAIVKNIVESSGGSITFETVTNVGTVFYVRLPLLEEIS